MTIDEAIAHAREVADEQRESCNLAWVWDNQENIKKCAEEHEQLAEWLEELKALKDGSIPIIHGKEELKLHDNRIRNKAVDDFANRLSSKIKYEIDDCADELRWIEEIAKQLKGGGVDG